MINGSESIPWVDGDLQKPDIGSMSLGTRAQQEQSPALVWGKGHLTLTVQIR